MKLTVAVGLIAFAFGFIVCKQWPSPPAGMSRDSLRVVAIDTLLGRGKARADSAIAIARPAVKRLAQRADSVNEKAKASLDSARQTTAPADAVTAIDYWRARALSAEVLLDLNIDANKVINDSLAKGWHDQIEETARLSALVGQVQDSLQWVKDSLGSKTRQLAKVQRPCRIGTVNGGWDPLRGKAELTLGGSCEVVRLVQAIL